MFKYLYVSMFINTSEAMERLERVKRFKRDEVDRTE